MDDQTRDEAPGSGVNSDAPLKRDRKALRSSKPLSTRQPEEPALSEPVLPEAEAVVPELREPELTPAEQLFAGAWAPAQGTPAVPVSSGPDRPAWSPPAEAASDFFEPVVPPSDRLSGPVTTSAPDPDLEPAIENDIEEPVASAWDDEGANRGFFGRGRRGPVEPAPAEDEPLDGGVPAAAPYVPPGGFDGPGHPKLGPLVPLPLPQRRGQTVLDIAALVASFLVPPVGLTTAIVAIVRGKKVRGWASDLARAAIAVSLVMTVVFAGVGGYVAFTEIEKAEQLAAVKAEQRAHDRVEAASVPFCEVLAANPTIYGTADPDYGWPAVDAPDGYNAAIAAYAAVWAQLAEVAPPGIAEETAAISARVANVVNIANALGTSNRAGDLLGLHEKDDLATVESWYVEYCNPAEIPAE